MNYLTLRRIEQDVQRQANQLGLDGDIYAKPVPPCGTIEQEWTITSIRIDVHRKHRIPEAIGFIAEMARAVVMSSSDDLVPMESWTMREAVHDYIATIGDDPGEVPDKRLHWYKPTSTPKSIQRSRRDTRCR